MKSEELNKLLIKNFPYLTEKYVEEISWQEGDSTGSHTVYGDVLTPYLVECIVQNNEQEIEIIFNFIEEVLKIDDRYAEEVISLSVFESIAYLFNERPHMASFLGENSKRVLNEVM